MATWARGTSSTTQDPEIRRGGSPRATATGRIVQCSGGFGGKSSQLLAHHSSPPHLFLITQPDHHHHFSGDALTCTTCRPRPSSNALPLEMPSCTASCIQTPLFSLLMTVEGGTRTKNRRIQSVQCHEIAQSPRCDRLPPQRIAESHSQPRSANELFSHTRLFFFFSSSPPILPTIRRAGLKLRTAPT